MPSLRLDWIGFLFEARFADFDPDSFVHEVYVVSLDGIVLNEEYGSAECADNRERPELGYLTARLADMLGGWR